MQRFLFLLPFLFFISLNCTGLKEVHNTDFEIKIIEVESWLNLMPGGPGSFHLSGEFSIHTDPDNVIMDLKLSEITVYSGEDLLYAIKPVFQYSRTEPDYSMNKNKIEVYQFYTESGLEINEILMGNNKINVEFNFVVEEEVIKKTMNDIEVTRAY
jgi:hypothetical protein